MEQGRCDGIVVRRDTLSGSRAIALPVREGSNYMNLGIFV